MRAGTSQTGGSVNAWQLTCYALAVPLVFFFEQYLYEAIAVLLELPLLLMRGFTQTVDSWVDSVQWDPGPLEAILMLPVVLVLGLLWVAFVISVGLFFVALTLVIFPPAAAAHWLATQPGLPRYLLSLIFVWYVGTFLYGVVFPLLWRLTEPIVAHTLGEVAFQRARARVYGERPRLTQPLYLAVAVVALLVGVGRVVVPAAEVAAAGAGAAWKTHISSRFEVPEWPKKFWVEPGRTVRTGINVPTQYHLGFHTDGEVFAAVDPEVRALVRPTTDKREDSVCLAAVHDSRQCRYYLQGFPTGGELLLMGKGQAARVKIYGPPSGDPFGHGGAVHYVWLAPGDVHTFERTWLNWKDIIHECNGGGVLYRTTRPELTSRWRPAPVKQGGKCFINEFGKRDGPVPTTAHSRGKLQVKATQVTWYAALLERRR